MFCRAVSAYERALRTAVAREPGSGSLNGYRSRFAGCVHLQWRERCEPLASSSKPLAFFQRFSPFLVRRSESRSHPSSPGQAHPLSMCSRRPPAASTIHQEAFRFFPIFKTFEASAWHGAAARRITSNYNAAVSWTPKQFSTACSVRSTTTFALSPRSELPERRAHRPHIDSVDDRAA